MQRRKTLSPYLNYAIVIVAFLALQIAVKADALSNSMQSLLVPVCCYVVMAVSLNLTVGVLGELSLGHGGFMSLGAFSGIIVSIALKNLVPLSPLRLAIALDTTPDEFLVGSVRRHDEAWKDVAEKLRGLDPKQLELADRFITWVSEQKL